MAENLLWSTPRHGRSASGLGRVDLHKLRELVQLHTAEEDIAQRTAYIARVQSSNLLFHILQSMSRPATQP